MAVSEAEAVVMQVLWERSPRGADEVVAALARRNDWAEPTIKTLLNRLLDKGAIQAARKGRRHLYSPVLTRPAWVQQQGEACWSACSAGAWRRWWPISAKQAGFGPGRLGERPLMHGNACLLVSMAMLMSACATHPAAAPREVLTRNANVDQRMLAPEGGAGGPARIERYTLAPTEVFRMPQPQDAGNPELPADSPRQTLAPTTVCARVIVDAQGRVQRVEPLADRDDCAAGTDAASADLVQAMVSKVRQWRFEPAAICHFAADLPPADPQSCEGAQSIEPVPVTLLYAFTFEVEQGRVRVESGGMRGR